MARRRKTTLALVLVGLAAIAGYFALGANERAASETAPVAAERPVELAAVEVARVQRQSLAADLRITGTLQPARRTIMTAQVPGTIEDVTVKVGQAVAEGDILLQFDLAPLETALAARRATREATQAQLELAQSVLTRNNRLGQSGIASEAVRLEAEANVANLRAQLKGLDAEVADAERNLGEAVVRAPFAGVISERKVEPGQTVGLNTELLSMVDLTTLEVEAGVPASSVADVAVGQVARLTIDGFPGQVFEAQVARLAPTAIPGSRTVRVYLEMANPQGRLRGGMFATGMLRTGERHDVIALPEAAIRRDEAGDFVLKEVDGRLQRQGVSVTPGAQGMVEVTDGLAEGEVVVVAPLPELKPDTQIVVGA